MIAFKESVKKEFHKEFKLFDKLGRELRNAICQKEITLFYPGSGDDVLRPLLLLDNCCDPSKEHSFVLHLCDRKDIGDCVLERLQEVLTCKVHGNSEMMRFPSGAGEVRIVFSAKSAFDLLPHLPSFDIYYERGFEIMRSGNKLYVQEVLKKTQNMLICDTSFCSPVVAKKAGFVQASLPQFNPLGFYKEFTVLEKGLYRKSH